MSIDNQTLIHHVAMVLSERLCHSQFCSCSGIEWDCLGNSHSDCEERLQNFYTQTHFFHRTHRFHPIDQKLHQTQILSHHLDTCSE